jgi:TetR/AcrR family transcriptional regulator, regulator of mycofactocin system
LAHSVQQYQGTEEISVQEPTPPSHALPSRRGRPPSTTRDAIARTALELFVRDGFDETTIDDVAAAVGIARRTVFRYFASKNDMVWGHFDGVLSTLRTNLGAARQDDGLITGLKQAVLASNDYEGPALEDLRLRMTLIMTVPTLQAHSMVRHAEWRQTVAAYAAARLGQPPEDHLPGLIGHLALAASMATFERWVAHPHEDLRDLLDRGYSRLARAFDE